jgi:phosphodiesterase/alkaline phosphatase D-like protein
VTAAALDRRRFLAAGAGATGLLVAPARRAVAARAAYPFTLGVASGDPTPAGAVLWTRLAPVPLSPTGGLPPRTIEVEWEGGDVAADGLGGPPRPDRRLARARPDFRDPRSPVVATEFVTTSISSLGTDHGAALAENPHVRYTRDERGYTRCRITPDALRVDLRGVGRVARRGAPVRTVASWVVEDGRPGAERA